MSNRGRSVVLRPRALYWLEPEGEEGLDRCAHGGVSFSIGDVTFVRPEDGDFNVTAAGLFLLRTLTHSHTTSCPVAEDSQLFPCCGHAPFRSGRGFPVIVGGCAIGVDPEVARVDDSVVIRAESGFEESASAAEWRHAVLGFVDGVRAFYDRSPPRIPFDGDDEDGWSAFWQEWWERRRAAS